MSKVIIEELQDQIDPVVDTTLLQCESLIQFAACIGYEVVVNEQNNIVRFKQPNFRSVGEEYISVRRMIKLHNSAAEDIFEFIKTLPKEYSFQDFLNGASGHAMIETLFAGSSKIVRKVKGQYHRKQGFAIQSHKVEFNSDKDYAHYGHLVEVKEAE